MSENESRTPNFDWCVTSFEGARREQLRRWARLPLETILVALEEMQDIAHMSGAAPAGEHGESVRRLSVKEPSVEYGETGTDQGVDSREDVRQLKQFLEKPDDQA